MGSSAGELALAGHAAVDAPRAAAAFVAALQDKIIIRYTIVANMIQAKRYHGHREGRTWTGKK